MRIICALALVASVALPFGQVWAAEDTANKPASTDKTEPLWELGFGGAVAYLPHYPAAAQNQTRFLPFPFFVYRGEVIRSDEKGFLRGRIINSERVELDLSFSGSLPVDSDDNDAREGMEELDWLGEVGPRLQVNLLKTGNHSQSAKVDFELPARAVFSTDFSEAPDYRGFRIAPGLVYSNENLGDTGIDLRVSAAANFATEKLMDYYYEVAPQFVRSNRPAFDADAGYLGARFGFNLKRKFWSRVTGFLNTSVWNFNGATNTDSPLHLETFNYGVVAGFRVALFQSDERVRDR
jgi:outer membrane scaffolding protein for murein synthesis (MipA/OmpV family)